ncbi:MAG: hypothetical protein ACE5K1_01500 [Acidiferrobacterales bacterium]
MVSGRYKNLQLYPPLLPTAIEDESARLPHLRLHNGTIWRWNRPLIGFCPKGRPHKRIEHRVVPAGPSIIDTVANAALFFGLVNTLARQARAPEAQLPFEQARTNFYTAAKDGLDAEIVWLQGKPMPIRALLLDELLAMPQRGLEKQGLAPGAIRRFLNIIEARVRSARNDAAWQRAHVEKHGKDVEGPVAAYRAHPRGGAPVHEWEL